MLGTYFRSVRLVWIVDNNRNPNRGYRACHPSPVRSGQPCEAEEPKTRFFLFFFEKVQLLVFMQAKKVRDSFRFSSPKY